MSVMGKIKQMLKGHEEQAGQGIDKAGDFVDGRTQGKYSGQVDSVQERLNQQLGSDQARSGPGRPDAGRPDIGRPDTGRPDVGREGMGPEDPPR
ncbi:MT0933-like antitoxin protein [Streptomyces sp. cf124]|nr:antitoxin [Streptomyces caniscabiei]UJV42321.1 antitoxin [Streptomyces sp. AMCC400023]SFN21196.1 MT0933-like antitoxin protein [Streptomyces sp. cf124]MBE4753818.1 antitoxin [Streptomyces caniscabiei]MBE4767411.1 antitoxin [Streptomyces caniscabiei]